MFNRKEYYLNKRNCARLEKERFQNMPESELFEMVDDLMMDLSQ